VSVGAREMVVPLDLIVTYRTGKVNDLIGSVQTLFLGESVGTHVGVIVTRDILPHIQALKPGKLYYVESNVKDYEGPPDVLTGTTCVDGFQIKLLEDALLHYDRVLHFELKYNPWLSHPTETSIAMEGIFEEHKEKTYTRNPFSFAAALLPWLSPLGTEEGFYCSQLALYIYQSLGVIFPVGKYISPQELSSDRNVFASPVLLTPNESRVRSRTRSVERRVSLSR
jgi:hypothetical protein